MSGWDVAAGDPVHPGVLGRLDLVGQGGPCGAADPAWFEPLAGRHLVVFNRPPDDDALARLTAADARVRWLYRQLGIAEVDASEELGFATLGAMADVVPAWSTVGTTRGLVVGLNAVCAFASKQATDLEAFYRHPTGIGYPVITSHHGEKELDLDSATELETPPALVPVVNLSLGTLALNFPTAANDIVNLATAAASGQVLVVMAAGNCGERPGDTMSAWARPEWVLSVGAVADASGTRTASYSSRGNPGPDLVALGHSELDHQKHGTSFAAPRVSQLARLVVAAFCQLGREVMVSQGAVPMGVPAVGWGVIDDFADQMWWEPESASAIQALPLVGVHADVVDELTRFAASPLTVTTTPAIVRAVLLSSARPVPGASKSEAGAGFVDQELVIDRLASVTAAELWEWFGRGVSPPVETGWSALRPFDAAGLHDLASVVLNTGPTVKFDYKTGRWAALPMPAEQLREQHPRGWPIDLTGIRL